MAYIYPVVTPTSTKYRVYYLFKTQKIYIGIYDEEAAAMQAYAYTHSLLQSSQSIADYCPCPISFSKYVSLLNFRDHDWYATQPIYLADTYFYYYLTPSTYLLLDKKDLLFFSSHRISKKNHSIYIHYPFCQLSILSRFGIPPSSVYNRDYQFKNGNRLDFRRENLAILNPYLGVTQITLKEDIYYKAQIYTDRTLILGHYDTAVEAAIAYNKAADFLEAGYINKNYKRNEFPYLTQAEYEKFYQQVKLTERLLHTAPRKRAYPSKEYRGVCKDKDKYRALIGYKNKQIYLGIYATSKRAAQAYNFASICLYGKEGYINTISPLTNPTDEAKILKKLQPYLATK